MIASTFDLARRVLGRLRYLANPKVTFPLNQNSTGSRCQRVAA
jgi:hypothetical protein